MVAHVQQAKTALQEQSQARIGSSAARRCDSLALCSFPPCLLPQAGDLTFVENGG
jgi:hypothetical protein